MTTENLFTEEEIEKLHEIQNKRGEVFLNPTEEEFDSLRQLRAETTTPEDYAFMHYLGKRLSKEMSLFTSVFADMWKDFGYHRCSVCSLTEKQAEAINYNCILEC